MPKGERNMNPMENLPDKIEAFISAMPQDLQAFMRTFIDLIDQQWPIAEQYWLDDEGRVQYRYPRNRGWICPGEDEGDARKELPQADLVTHIGIGGHNYHLTDTDVLTVGEVSFCKKGSWHGMPLEDVPPRFFSEVMRDGDLLVSVAGVGDDAFASPSTIETRKQILGNLIPLLGLSNVTIGEDNFLHIEGKMANYRLHLASANIHIEPGSYLCVVPDWQKRASRQQLFLPFEDEDMKFAEVVSKMLLLASDDKIKDGSILNQIRRHSAI